MIATRLLKDTRGAAVIEFAFALPVIAIIMVGILQMGLVLHASAGIQHAVSEGIRFARVNPEASDAEVEQHAREALVGIDREGVTLLTFARETSEAEITSGTIEMEYEIAPVIPFVPLPPFVVSQTETSYLPY